MGNVPGDGSVEDAAPRLQAHRVTFLDEDEESA